MNTGNLCPLFASLRRGQFLSIGLTGFLSVMLSVQALAQTFTTLHSFAPPEYGHPQATLVLSNNTLYGTATFGGGARNGTVFSLNTDGTGFSVLYAFTGGTDGSFPYGSLVVANGTLYGTTRLGGDNYNGNVFSISAHGTGLMNLYSFNFFDTGLPGISGTNFDGAGPVAGLAFDGTTLYGTAITGGDAANGTVFAVSTDGSVFSTLYSFSPMSPCCPATNIDGAVPWAGLIISSNTLFGTASQGGSSGNGTVYGINTDGTGFTNLYSFTATSGSPGTNTDGAGPQAALVLSGNSLYGATTGGGIGGAGTLFKLKADGTGFTVLHSFSALSSDSPGINSDGANPQAELLISGNTLYGTAKNGGASGSGTVFSINTDGRAFTVLHAFSPVNNGSLGTNNDGANPSSGLIIASNTLYGTTFNGGTAGFGTVFGISLPVSLTIIPSGQNVILTWPTNAAGFTLQSTTNFVLPTSWTVVSQSPVVVNGQNVITNLITGTQKYYRLAQ